MLAMPWVWARKKRREHTKESVRDVLECINDALHLVVERQNVQGQERQSEEFMVMEALIEVYRPPSVSATECR